MFFRAGKKIKRRRLWEPAWNGLFVPLTLPDARTRHRQTVATSMKLSSSSILSSLKLWPLRNRWSPRTRVSRSATIRDFPIDVTSSPSKLTKFDVPLCVARQSHARLTKKYGYFWLTQNSISHVSWSRTFSNVVNLKLIQS